MSPPRVTTPFPRRPLEFCSKESIGDTKQRLVIQILSGNILLNRRIDQYNFPPQTSDVYHRPLVAQRFGCHRSVSQFIHNWSGTAIASQLLCSPAVENT